MSGRTGSGKGIALGLLAAATFGASPFSTSLLHAGWSAGSLVLIRVLGAVALLAIPALVIGRGHRITGAGIRQSLAFGAVGVAGVQYCFFNALGRLSVGLTLLIEYSGVLLVVLWMWLRHGHKPKLPTIGGGIVALVGLSIALDLFGTSKVDGVGVLWAIGGAFGTAGYYVIAAGAHRTGWPELTTVWAGLLSGGVLLLIACGLGLLPLRSSHADVVLADHHVHWLWSMSAMVVLTGTIAYAAGVLAARLLGARNSSFLGLTEVLFGMVFAWLLVDQSLGLAQLLGGVLVMAGVAAVQLDEGISVSPDPIPQAETRGGEAH